MSEFAFKPSTQTTGQVEARILLTQYGGGFAQAMADGPNNVLQNWNLTFRGREWPELQAIHTFLKARGGWIRFTWTPLPPFDVTEGEMKIRCMQWGWMYEGGHVVGVWAIFLQQPGI